MAMRALMANLIYVSRVADFAERWPEALRDFAARGAPLRWHGQHATMDICRLAEYRMLRRCDARRSLIYATPGQKQIFRADAMLAPPSRQRRPAERLARKCPIAIHFCYHTDVEAGE